MAWHEGYLTDHGGHMYYLFMSLLLRNECLQIYRQNIGSVRLTSSMYRMAQWGNPKTIILPLNCCTTLQELAHCVLLQGDFYFEIKDLEL